MISTKSGLMSVWLSLLVGLVVADVVSVNHANAATYKPLPQVLKPVASPPVPEAASWILMEAETGWVITEGNAETRVDPASLTKLMTTYLSFEALNNGRISAADTTLISPKAWKAPGSRMFAQVDTEVRIDVLLKGLIVQSGNDAAVALAEHLGGSESGFAAMMNKKALELGLSGTHFVNSSGLPDPDHYTTALDVALLSRAIINDFPELYHLFSIQEYTYNKITQPNRNRLLWRDDSFDGLKTGHTKAAGYCLAGSGVRNDLRFIAVVMGTSGSKARVQAVQTLLEYGFSMFKRARVAVAGEVIKRVSLYKGEAREAELTSATDVLAMIPSGGKKVELEYILGNNLSAPLKMGEEVGRIKVSYDGELMGDYALVSRQTYNVGPIWTRIVDTIRLMLVK